MFPAVDCRFCQKFSEIVAESTLLLEQQQHREFWVGWWGGSQTNYLYPARWGWINDIVDLILPKIIKVVI